MKLQENSQSRPVAGVQILQRRVDALYMRFRGDPSSEVIATLNERLAIARKLGIHVAVEVGELCFQLDVRSHADGFWRLSNADADIVIRITDALRGWHLEVKPRALLLARAGARDVAGFGRRIAQAILHEVRGERLNRLDLAVDVAGLDVRDIDGLLLVCHNKLTVERTHYRASQKTGFTVGRRSSPMSACIYDKREELAIAGNEEKRATEEAAWRIAGWDGLKDVTRVEFRFHNDLLAEGGVRDNIDAAIGAIERLWTYATESWLSLRVADHSRRTNWSIDPRWTTIRSAFGDAEPVMRERVRTAMRAKTTYSNVLSYVAGCGELVPSTADTRKIEKWPAFRAEQHVRDRVLAVFAQAGHLVVSELLVGDPRDVARFVVEKERAVDARTASNIVLLLERAARERAA